MQTFSSASLVVVNTSQEVLKLSTLSEKLPHPVPLPPGERDPTFDRYESVELTIVGYSPALLALPQSEEDLLGEFAGAIHRERCFIKE